MGEGVLRYVRRHHVALLALMIALGGTSYAATKIGSKNIKSNAVKSRHIADGQVTAADIGPGVIPGAGGSVSGSGITDGSVTPDDLGEVPAAKRQGAGQLDIVLPSTCGSHFVASGGSDAPLSFAGVAYSTPGTAPATVGGPPGCGGTNLRMPRNGLYRVTAGVIWPSNSAGTRFIAIKEVGGSVLVGDRRQAVSGFATEQSVTVEDRFSTGDEVQAIVFQDSTSTLTMPSSDARTFLEISYIGR